MKSHRIVACAWMCLMALPRTGWAAPSAPAAAIEAKVSLSLDKLPAAALLIDEASRDVFVLPPEAAQAVPGLQVKPASFLASRILDSAKVNETTSSLSERLGLLVAQTQKKLGTLRFDAGWARDVLTLVGRGGTLAQGLGTSKLLWPLPLPLSQSTLSAQSGLLLVFSCRNADKSGILEKMDLVAWEKGRLVRSYWSRSLNDPSLSEKAVGVIDKVATHFQKSFKNPPAAPSESGTRLAVDKRVSERELVAIESVIKGLVSPGMDPLLTPYEVNRSDVRYRTPLEASKVDLFSEKLKSVAPLLSVRRNAAEFGILQIVSGPSPQEP